MRPTDILLQEHRLIELAVLELESVALDVERGLQLQKDRAHEVMHFLSEFADGLHRAKEETLFFPQMLQRGFGPRAGLISIMLEEHREDAACLDQVSKAFECVNGAASRARFAKLARRYIYSIRNHMRTEKTIVFWVASRLLTPDEEQTIVDGFDRLDGASRSLLSRLRLRSGPVV